MVSGGRSLRRRTYRRASSQKTTAASVWRIRIPPTLTQEDGSETDARTAATHADVRGLISSPFRTIIFPRGIFVNTLSTERDASSRRCAVSAAFNDRLGR